MAKINTLNITKILVLGLILRIIIVLFSGSHPDILNHLDWGIRFLDLGPQKFYENIFWGVSWANQPFGSILLFALIALLKNFIFGTFLFLNNTFSLFPSFIIPILESNLHIWLVKLPFILSDIGIAYLIYKIVSKHYPKKGIIAACLFLFNPVIIYNSAIWGQTDSLINLLALTGLYLVFEKKYFTGIFIFLFTFIFKLSLIIYLPILGLLLLRRIHDWKKMILPFISFFIFMFLLAIPFRLDGFSSIKWIWYMYTNRVLVRQGSMLNGNAFNLWSLLFSIDLSKSEFTQFFGFTYQQIGRILYIIFLIPIWIKFSKNKLNLTLLLNALVLSAFGSFIFLTNMHERYLYPIFPLISILIFFPNPLLTRNTFIILSLIHFLNLYNLWFYPLIPNLKLFLIYSNFLFCRILSFILLIIYFDYLIKYLKCHDQKN